MNSIALFSSPRKATRYLPKHYMSKSSYHSCWISTSTSIATFTNEEKNSTQDSCKLTDDQREGILKYEVQ